MSEIIELKRFRRQIEFYQTTTKNFKGIRNQHD
jgi:hypothetical protein